MKPLKAVRSVAVVLPEENIDTDRIIPARFLSTTTSDGLGKHAFHDARRLAEGVPDESFALNDARAHGAEILIAGRNFGCGSSREHAAWALGDIGVRVVISSEIADIFRANASRNGILPIVLDVESHGRLMACGFETMEVDLEACEIRPEGSEPIAFEVDGFMRRCLLDGTDHLGFLLGHYSAIESFDAARDARLAGAES
ncbi:MAG: 3-isopropylmalate dehydratase small subunit [Planctomycetota bacterium]